MVFNFFTRQTLVYTIFVAIHLFLCQQVKYLLTSQNDRNAGCFFSTQFFANNIWREEIIFISYFILRNHLQSTILALFQRQKKVL